MSLLELEAAARSWLRLDRDPETRSEVEHLLATSDHAALAAAFGSRIAFGTAGLRAEMRAGPAFLNELVIIQSTQGLVRYMLALEGGMGKGLVVGHDHRHRSKRFAELAAGVARAEGMPVWLLEGLVHTPMVPYACAQLGAALGIMITASHNPAKDNGYKVYFSNHVQIVPPHDALIAASILESLDVAPTAFSPASPVEPWTGTSGHKDMYFEMVQQLAKYPADNARCELVFCYSAMHGVGADYARRAFAAFQFKPEQLSMVASQEQPDPDFPTVKFPNPEEKGALDLAIAHADSIGSTIVLANDPDADRFCAAEKSGGSWRVFTGDQLGTILGHNAFVNHVTSGLPVRKLAMCTTTVSSKMLAAIGRKEGFLVSETLTGFKYLGNEALRLEKEGYACPFAYEEAIGYMAGTTIRDKDGVSTLAIFCELAQQLFLKGLTLAAHWDTLEARYGTFITSNSYYISRDKAVTKKIFEELRYGTSGSTTLALPKTLAGFAVSYWRDLTVGFDSLNAPSFAPTLPVDPSAQMISFTLGTTEQDETRDEVTVTVTGTIRTSGTEPKIKFYLEGSGVDREAVRRVLGLVSEAVGVELLQWEKFGLERA